MLEHLKSRTLGLLVQRYNLGIGQIGAVYSVITLVTVLSLYIHSILLFILGIPALLVFAILVGYVITWSGVFSRQFDLQVAHNPYNFQLVPGKERMTWENSIKQLKIQQDGLIASIEFYKKSGISTAKLEEDLKVIDAIVKQYWEVVNTGDLPALKEDFLKKSWVKPRITADHVILNKFGTDISFYYDSDDQLRNTIHLCNEILIGEEYRRLDFKGKDVVDIGASIGDSAIYFCLAGARQVYAFEPYMYSYQIASRNLNQSVSFDKVHLMRVAVGAEDTTIYMPDDFKNYGGTSLIKCETGLATRQMTLAMIVKMCGINDGALKMDCEGSEYPIFESTPIEVLRRFTDILVEFHEGVESIERKLKEAGFTTDIPNPNHVGCRLGVIVAKRL